MGNCAIKGGGGGPTLNGKCNFKFPFFLETFPYFSSLVNCKLLSAWYFSWSAIRSFPFFSFLNNNLLGPSSLKLPLPGSWPATTSPAGTRQRARPDEEKKITMQPTFNAIVNFEEWRRCYWCVPLYSAAGQRGHPNARYFCFGIGSIKKKPITTKNHP